MLQNLTNPLLDWAAKLYGSHLQQFSCLFTQLHFQKITYRFLCY